jgi:tetratricopeptide (TPR) repeat protein
MHGSRVSRPVPIARYVASIALPLLLAACANPQLKMTRAALTGDAATVDALLKPGSPGIDSPVLLDAAMPGCPGQSTLTPLQAAACGGHEGIVRKLLAAKADVNLAAGARTPPLLLAMANGHDDTVRLLVESGARVDAVDLSGNTALILCAMKGNRPLAEFLLKNGASPQARNGLEETALLLSADPGLAKMLAALGSDPLARNISGETGLHLAARSGNAGMARFFLERGVDVGHRSNLNATALDIARGDLPRAETASPSADGRSAVASARGGRRRGNVPAKAAAQAGRSNPASVRGSSEVVAVLEEWMTQLFRKELAAADLAAKEGRSLDALALYAAALPRAVELGGTSEQELRVKIVRYAASMPQPPGIPEKAREHLVRSAYLLKKGQDIGLVENEMTAAMRIAPWWAEGYYNLGQLQAEQGKFDPAERNLNLFIAAAPGDARAQAAQDKIYEIRMGKEEDAKFRGVQGRWADGNGKIYVVFVTGDKLQIHAGAGLNFTLNHRNGVLEGTVEGASYPGPNKCTIPGQMHPVTGKLAPDARSITLEYLWSSYKTNFHYVNMMGVPSNNCLTCDEVCDSVTVSATNRVSLHLRPSM